MAMQAIRLLIATAVLGATMTATGATYYVNGSCGNSVCASPHGPKATIQAGIDASSDGDEVIVADGVYTGSGNKGLDFEGRLITLRSANGPATCVIDCEGAGRAVYLHSHENLGAVIQGFTITNGSAQLGGAIRLEAVSATINDCVFTNNAATIAGAVHHAGSGGMWSLILTGCSFAGNRADVGAGAVLSLSGTNTTPWGIFVAVDCAFTDNWAAEGGGALAIGHMESTYVNCFIAGNTAGALAGGIAEGSTSATLTNCVLSRNEAGLGGGAMVGGQETVFLNSTVAGNLGGGIGGGNYAEGSPLFGNCIVWGNSQWQIERPGATAVYSDVQDGWPGVGNIDADPLFVQPGSDNLRLSIGSPCVNAGDNSAIPPGITTDLDGNPRIQGDVVDMGAYEGEYEAQPAEAGDDDARHPGAHRWGPEPAGDRGGARREHVGPRRRDVRRDRVRG